jgi:hypothetical protein
MTRLLAFFLLLALVGCESEGDRFKARMASEELGIRLHQQTAEMELENVRLTLKIVQDTQGEEAAHNLDVCLSKGYEVSGDPWVGDASKAPTLSRRRKAECDAIIKSENRLSKRLADQTAADEKRKDDAYDKAHKHGGAQ